MQQRPPGTSHCHRASLGRVSIHSVFFVLVLLAAPPGVAQTPSGSDTLDLVMQENRVFAAVRYTQTLTETPANVTVLTREHLRSFGYRSVNEALLSIAGTYNAASQWPAIGVRGVAVPGDFGSRLLYMVNGMPIYEPTYGGFFLEYLDIESIDRIEFINGPGSSLYGSGAVQGVVNLITRNGTNAAGKTLSLDVGNHDSSKLYGSWGSHDSDGVDRFVSVSAARSKGRDVYLREFDQPAFNGDLYRGVSTDNDGSRNLRLFGRVATSGAWAQGLLISGHRQDPLASYHTAFNQDLKLDEMLGAVEVGVDHELASGARLTSRAYYFNVDEEGDYPYSSAPTATESRGMPANFINVSDLASNTAGAELRYDRYFSSGHHLLTGLEVKYVRARYQIGDQPGMSRSGVVTTDERNRYWQSAAFVQDEWRLSAAGTLFLGARVDAYSGFSKGVKSRLSPRVAYVHKLSPRTTGKLIYGEAYRAPTLYESLYQDGTPPETIWSNPDLKPELARSFEALIEHEPSHHLKWRLSSFINQLHDTPQQVVTPVLNGMPCKFGADSCVQYRNADSRQQVVGMEASARYQRANFGHWYASLVLQRGTSDGAALANSPRYQLKGGISRALPWPNTDAALEAQYIGSAAGRLETSTGSAGNPARTASVPAYLLLNAALNFRQPAHGWRASLRVHNLLDRQFYTVASRELQPLQQVPAAGRLISLQLQLDF